MGELYKGAQIFEHGDLLNRSPTSSENVLQQHYNRANNEVVELPVARQSTTELMSLRELLHEGSLDTRSAHDIRFTRHGTERQAMAQLWSSYGLHSDGRQVARGINSIEAMKESGGWRVTSIMVQAESAAVPLPKRCLP